MSDLITGNNKIAKEICDALGLKHVRKLDIHMESNSIFIVEAEMYMEVDGAKQLPAVLRKFTLIPLVEAEETTSLGDSTKSFAL